MITKRDQQFIHLCFTAARDLPKVAGARVVAALVYKNKVVAWGYNSKKTHPLQGKFGRNRDSIYLHAEIDAIKNGISELACRANTSKHYVDVSELSRYTLYVARAKCAPHNKQIMLFGEAKPCEGCMEAIEHFNLKRVVYTADNQELVELTR
jgi:tRNA(Arg) A34 adenosine deaminase TadA